MSTNSAYKCLISNMSLILGNKEINIPTESVSSVVIDTDYENKIMPIIYVSLSINLELYNQLVTNSTNGKIYLNIKKYDVKVNIAIKEDKIKNQFVYFIPSNATYIKDLGTDEDNKSNSFINITIGLMDMKLLDYKKKIFNTVYKNIDTKNLINIITSGRELVLSPIVNNKQYDEFLMPPITSRSEALQYLFDIHPFFNTLYTYFTDFDKNYLIDRNGNNKGKMNTVFINIGNIDSRSSYYEGITSDTDKNCYIMHLNPDDKTITPNKTTEKVTNQIIGIYQDEVTTVDLNINNSKQSDMVKPIFIRADELDTHIIKSKIENTSVILNFSKANIDADIFTPDKSFIVNNREEDNDYNGKYIIMYKKEVIGKMDVEYATNTIIGLKRIGPN